MTFAKPPLDNAVGFDHSGPMSIRAGASQAGSRSLAGVWPRSVARVAGVILFAGLTWVGANITIPIQPVPITLQTLFVVLSGAVLGARGGVASQLLYITAGAVGLPVFAGGAFGIGVVVGHTGGYLLGFLVTPWVVGTLIGRRSSLWWTAVCFYVGAQLILWLGTIYLWALFPAFDFTAALVGGYLPFQIGAVLKTLAATSIYRSYKAIRLRRS